ACIEKSPVRGPQAQDDTPLSATRWAEADERWRGYVPSQRATDGVCLHDQQAEGVAREGTAGMEQAAVADLHEAVGQDMLEEPVDKRHDVKVRGAEACTTNLTVGDGDGAVCEADEAWVGDGAPEDIGGEGGEGSVSVGIGPTMDMPGEGPDLW